MSSSHEGGHEQCSCALQPTGTQSILELEFERGIWSAAMDGEVEKVRKHLAKNIHPSSTDSSGYTALHYASRNGHVSVCQLLLSSGANVNSQTPGGVTPLHRAAYCGHEGVVKVLLERGAQVELTDSDGMTALHKAIERGHFPVTKLLLAASPDSVAIRDSRGRLPADLLTENMDSRLGQLLTL